MHRWKYMQTVIMDGNFKSEHLMMRNPEDDVCLSDGEGFMVRSGPYKEYLGVVTEVREVSDYLSHRLRCSDRRTQTSTCNDHRAVNQVNSYTSNLDATGIGACACGHHGCFFPHCVVDFQKGER